MIKYKLSRDTLSNKIDTVIKTDEDVVMSIPFDPANRDYQEYLEWLAEGNTPEEAE